MKCVKTGRNWFPSQIWKHSWIFMGSSGGTSLGLLVWEAARPATALSLCRPTHFRQRSVISKTVEAMSAATPLMLSSVAVIYTKWRVPELDAMQTARLQCRTCKCNRRIGHKSSLCHINVSDTVGFNCCFCLFCEFYVNSFFHHQPSRAWMLRHLDIYCHCRGGRSELQRLFIVLSQKVIMQIYLFTRPTCWEFWLKRRACKAFSGAPTVRNYDQSGPVAGRTSDTILSGQVQWISMDGLL